ncbi:MAG: hypothetical protein J7M30_06770 [Deltaproteobacteria bacterium]|nr:hypothetical protein [Deltaproteobacteria bacterium]
MNIEHPPAMHHKRWCMIIVIWPRREDILPRSPKGIAGRSNVPVCRQAGNIEC